MNEQEIALGSCCSSGCDDEQTGVTQNEHREFEAQKVFSKREQRLKDSIIDSMSGAGNKKSRSPSSSRFLSVCFYASLASEAQWSEANLPQPLAATTTTRMKEFDKRDVTLFVKATNTHSTNNSEAKLTFSTVQDKSRRRFNILSNILPHGLNQTIKSKRQKTKKIDSGDLISYFFTLLYTFQLFD